MPTPDESGKTRSPEILFACPGTFLRASNPPQGGFVFMFLKSGTLRLAALASAIGVMALCSPSFAQDDNPMGLPPRTAPPPVTVQPTTPGEPEPPASGQQPAAPAIAPIPNDDSRFVFKTRVQEVVLHAA